MNKPNILFIMTDQHRFDRLSCTGDPVLRTPHIDSIATCGIRFSNAYTPSPICAPARAAIKSGMYPPGCGVVENWVPFKNNCELLTHRLQQNGYQTVICGKLHFVPHQELFGFHYKRMNDAPYSIYADEDQYSDYIAWLKQTAYKTGSIDPVALFDGDECAFLDENWYRFIMGSNFRNEAEHDIPWVTNESLQFLRTRDKDTPFFLFTSFFGPHQPFEPPAPWNVTYAPGSISLPPQFGADMQHNPIFQHTCASRAIQFRKLFDIRTYQEMIAAYYGQIAMIDHYVGQLLEYLKSEGLWEKTLIIFTSDHGDHNGAYGLFFKGDMYDSCCKVPLLIKPPYVSKGGIQRDIVVNTLDLYGTILDTAGDLSWKQPHIEAQSLVPLFTDPIEKDELAGSTFSIIGRNPQTNLTMLRNERFKLIRLARGDDEPLYELYDMSENCVEVRNLFEQPAYQTTAGRLKAELDAWWTRQSLNYPEDIKSIAKINR